MDYILEELDTSGKKVMRNILVQNNRISYISDRPLRMNKMRSNLQGFQLLPGAVMVDYTLYEKSMDGKLIESLDKLLELGCTTVASTFPMYYEKDFRQRLAKFREVLNESYLDYCIGLSIPIQKLTPTIIRMCQKEKLPFISIEIDHPEKFSTMIWEWIRDANFPYQVQLIPNWDGLGFEGKKKRSIIQQFTKLMKQKEIEIVKDFPGEQKALPLNIIKQLGIYPSKGDFVNGGELDYLLYYEGTKSKSRFKTGDPERKPNIVVKDGLVIKAAGEYFVQHGQGKEIVVQRPGLFKTLM